jgi:hypothetical protein
MARLQGRNYTETEKRDKLTIADLGKNVAAVLTIADVFVGNMRDDESATGWREVIKIGTEEFPDRWYYPNFAGVTALIEAFGEETHEWTGHLLPLVVTTTTNPKTRRPVEALHVAPKNEWRGLISGTGEVTGAPGVASAPDEVAPSKATRAKSIAKLARKRASK